MLHLHRLDHCEALPRFDRLALPDMERRDASVHRRADAPVPLFRAAGMSAAWILTNLCPPLFGITYIIWSFKVVRMRGKKAIYSVMLLLPVFNVLALLYLAMSNTEREEGKADPNVINLGGTRRDAA